MNRLQAEKVVAVVEVQLAKWTGAPVARLNGARSALDPGNDFLFEAGNKTFVVEFKSRSLAADMGPAIEQLHKVSLRHRRAIPLLVVPFMGDSGRERCRLAGINWFDLSGNAEIAAPGLHVHIEGRPNQFKRRGRKENPFAPKAARITRQLLIEPSEKYLQIELADKLQLAQGYVSRILRRLQDEKLVKKNDSGRWQVANPSLLLDAWAERYEFDAHEIVRGHMHAKSAQELIHKTNRALDSKQHAFTGLAAAWCYTEFVSHRTVTVYVSHLSDVQSLESQGFVREPRGANLWIVVPNDIGVFDGRQTVREMPCVHPVQAYVDLRHHPERAAEAADELRQRHLNWGQYG